eukprot:2186523-Pyramimonas_sp.AAC.1
MRSTARSMRSRRSHPSNLTKRVRAASRCRAHRAATMWALTFGSYSFLRRGGCHVGWASLKTGSPALP